MIPAKAKVKAWMSMMARDEEDDWK